MRAIRVHYDGRALIPDEPVKLPRDCTLIIRVEDQAEHLPDASFLHSVLVPTNRDAAQRLISDPESALENF